MTQLDLLSYRRSDPVTSKLAAQSAEHFRSGDHAKIIEALDRAARPLAAEQISDALEWADHVRVNRRLGELEREGLIKRTSELHTNRSGRKAFRYSTVTA